MLRTILLGALAAAPNALCAQTASPALIADLAPSGTLRASINYGNAILAQRDATTGELSGVSVDLARELGRRLGIPVTLVPFAAAGKVTDALKTGAWDVAFLAIDPARATEIEFTQPYVKLEGTYLLPAGSPLHAVEDVDREGILIAVAKGSAYDLYLSRTLKHAQLERAETTDAAIEMFLDEEYDAVAGIRGALVLGKQRVIGGTVLSGAFMTIPQAMGVPKGHTLAAAYVQAFVEQMKQSGFVARSLKAHRLENEAEVIPALSAEKNKE
jgi:polar amino acid transport system substrate-binding protein